MDENISQQSSAIYLEGTNGKTIFIIDGLTGTPKPYEVMAHYFNNMGYTVKVPIMKNHGGKLSAVAETTIQEVKDQLKTEIKGDEYFIGTCSGALLALDLSTEYNRPAVLINPALDVSRWWVLLPTKYIFRSDWGLLNDESQLFRVPRYHKYPVSFLKAYPDYLESLKLDVSQPLLIFHSRGDIRAPIEGVMKLYNAAQNRKLVYLENSGHLAYLDYDQLTVFNEIQTFLEAN